MITNVLFIKRASVHDGKLYVHTLAHDTHHHYAFMSLHMNSAQFGVAKYYATAEKPKGKRKKIIYYIYNK